MINHQIVHPTILPAMPFMLTSRAGARLPPGGNLHNKICKANSAAVGVWAQTASFEAGLGSSLRPCWRSKSSSRVRFSSWSRDVNRAVWDMWMYMFGMYSGKTPPCSTLLEKKEDVQWALQSHQNSAYFQHLCCLQTGHASRLLASVGPSQSQISSQ